MPSNTHLAGDGLHMQDMKSCRPWPLRPWTLKRGIHDSSPTSNLIVSCEDWHGSDDPGNPHNWPSWKRIFNSAVPSGIAFVGSFTSSVITPGFASIQADLSTSAAAAHLAFAMYVLGMGIGAIFAAPASETLGRRMVYWISIPTFALFILGTGLSQSASALIVTRFFAGIFASPSLSIGSGTISDIWPPEERTIPMSAYTFAPCFGPALGPLIGGAVVTWKGWRWTSWTSIFFTILFLSPSAFMSETYKRKILVSRAKKLRVPGPPSFLDNKTGWRAISYFARKTLQRPLHMLFTEPVVAAFSIYVSFNFALLYCFLAAFPYVFETAYGFSLESVGLTFFGLTIGSIAALFVVNGPDRMLYRRRQQIALVKDSNEKLAPEHRLYASMFGGPLICISLFLFAWSADKGLHWIVPVIAEAGFGMGSQCVWMSAIMYIMEFYGSLYGASANSAGTLIRYIAGTAFPLFAVQMYAGLGVGWATSLLGFISAVLAAVPFALFYLGPRLRQRSGYLQGDG